MTLLSIILLGLLALIILLLLIALFIKKEYSVRCEILVSVPVDKAFDYLRQLKNQDQFNKWVMVDPDMKREFRGSDGTVGFVYSWNGNKKAGEGEQEITKIEEGKSIDTEIRFVRPFPSVAYATISTEQATGSQTKVIWSNAGTMNYPMNIMRSMIVNMLAKDMDTSLANLKKILEK